MTRRPSAAPAPRPTEGDGGSTGQLRIVRKMFEHVMFSCFEANLNGEYFIDPKDNGYYRGIIWELWLGDYSLMVNMRHCVLMMIKNKFPGD